MVRRLGCSAASSLGSPPFRSAAVVSTLRRARFGQRLLVQQPPSLFFLEVTGRPCFHTTRRRQPAPPARRLVSPSPLPLFFLQHRAAPPWFLAARGCSCFPAGFSTPLPSFRPSSGFTSAQLLLPRFYAVVASLTTVSILNRGPSRSCRVPTPLGPTTDSKSHTPLSYSLNPWFSKELIAPPCLKFISKLSTLGKAYFFLL